MGTEQPVAEAAPRMHTNERPILSQASRSLALLSSREHRAAPLDWGTNQAGAVQQHYSPFTLITVVTSSVLARVVARQE